MIDIDCMINNQIMYFYVYKCYLYYIISENDERDWNLLHIAADAGHSDIVQWLTLLVVDLETETPTGYTPMHLAAMRGHTDCLRVSVKMFYCFLLHFVP